ncbi:MAG: cation-transporting P-type ATPase [Gammaproteobacteria bacterium]|nr:MAG: cation-transporting P-type ATPase [Gammaproteobacteria bacterium]
MSTSSTDERIAAQAHSRDADTVLADFGSGEQGLAAEEVDARLQRYGRNELPVAARDSWFKRFALQFHNVLIYILLIAAAGTAVLQEWVDTGVILAVVLINALIGVIQEGKAEKALDSIRAMLSPKASVLRDGERLSIDAAELVPGDLVLLKAGDRVPADLRLIKSQSLRIDEAVLTGESMAVDKETDPVQEDAGLGDRLCMAFSGTLVTYGRGSGVVMATGTGTQIGKVSELLSDVQAVTTPLLRDMAQFGRWLSLAIVLLAGITFAFGLWVRDYAGMEMFLAAVSLAVAAIPEGLPAIMTITLAIGVQRMARRNAIIRRLPAVETLGAVTVICSDKTGTLTRNEMTAQTVVTANHHYHVSGVGYAPEGRFSLWDDDIQPGDGHEVLQALLETGALCNEAEVSRRDGQWQLNGEPTEGALTVLAMKAGLSRRELEAERPRVATLPFDSAHKFMATLHDSDDGRVVLMKGAPEAVLDACSHERHADGDHELDRDRWEERIHEVAGRGQRLLALASGPAGHDGEVLDFEHVRDGLVLLGVIGIVDPPRSEAIEAVAACRDAGIRVKMITGDHGVTARAIGQQLGIGDGETAMSGPEIERIDDEALQEKAATIDVFARTTPEHKLRLVRALQARGNVVAMTGDGVNDAPALKRADVGIAMGIKGTEASKEASAMVLADDNFASIEHAVEEGRTVYDNLKKAILFILPTNGGQAFTIVAAILLGLTLPLTPVQVLWVNMVTAVTLALALAFEPPEPGLMERPPRDPATPLLTPLLIWRIAFVSAILVAGTFGHYLWLTSTPGVSDEFARTVAINTLVMGQVFYLWNSRYILAPVFNFQGLFGSRPVLYAVALLLVLQGLFTYAPPMQTLFSTAAIGAEDWLRILAFGLVLFVLVETEKAVFRRLLGRAGANV